MNLQSLLNKIEDNKEFIDKHRPLSEKELIELEKYYRVGLTYTSNALEGNTLTLSETKIILEDGITIGGKPLRDTYEATGHADAYDFMLKISKNKYLNITENEILELHKLFYGKIDRETAGKYREHQVLITGTQYIPPRASDVPRQMKQFIQSIETTKDKTHPVALAAYTHKKLVDIHPFEDGNGRTARLLMNLVLVNKGYQIVSIPPVSRNDYITALEKARVQGSAANNAFTTFIAESELEAQKDFRRMFYAESE